MALLERILLPIDFSERSTGAARYVEALANKGDCEVALVHVTTPLSYELSALEVGGTVLNDLNAERTVELRARLDAFAETELGGCTVERVLLEGDPANSIVEFAHRRRASLIIMPTHGYGLFRRFLLGSVTAKVLHDAECPVWTGIHLDQSPACDQIHFRRILVGVDVTCGPRALKAIDWGSQVAARENAEVTIVHAYPSLEGRSGEHFDPNWREGFTRGAAAEIAKLQEQLGTNYDVVLEAGEPAHVVCELASSRKADLLVIGRGSAAGVFGRLRANAYSIIRQSPCPVVSV
jgi:nucleotide-binding universal stress UspA family protein